MIEFFLAAIIVAVAPGPDNLFVLAQSATYGQKAGFCIILGLCTGIFVQTILLVVGLSALIAASPVAFFVLQCLGAAYLLYLAYISFKVRVGTIQDEKMKTAQVLSGVRLYFRGVIMNLTNPKAVLFCLSFIPPAVDLKRAINPSLQIFILGAEFMLATMIVFGSVALLAGGVKKFLLNSPKANRNLNWFSGAVFVFLAIALFVL